MNKYAIPTPSKWYCKVFSKYGVPSFHSRQLAFIGLHSRKLAFE